MKSALPKKSTKHQARIQEIVSIALDTAKDKIAFIILFGSFARGDWVYDRYTENGVIYEYASDYDFLIITKAKRKDDNNGISSFDLERKIDNEIRKRQGSKTHHHNHHFIIEPIDYVNSELEKGRYFFSDIKKEGILFYDSGEFKLAEARKLTDQEKRAIAKQDYNHWSKKAKNCLIKFKTMFELKEYNDSAFELHQAAEDLFNCTLLVLTGYKPKSHDLRDLNRRCAAKVNDFLTIFPIATKEQKECFKLLQKAYIESRYNKHYEITKEQLEYLLSRIEKLKDLVESVCKKKI